MSKVEVACTFTPGDVVAHFNHGNGRNISEEDAEAFLNTHRKQIEEAMCREGWESIESLGFIYFSGYFQEAEK